MNELIIYNWKDDDIKIKMQYEDILNEDILNDYRLSISIITNSVCLIQKTKPHNLFTIERYMQTNIELFDLLKTYVRIKNE